MKRGEGTRADKITGQEKRKEGEEGREEMGQERSREKNKRGKKRE